MKAGLNNPNALKPLKPVSQAPSKPKNRATMKFDVNNPAYPLENTRHEKFALEYALTANATQSYLILYDCEYDTAKTESSRLLAQPHIRARVDFIHKAQTDAAFATLYAGFKANKTVVHDEKAVLTEVPDHQARIAAAEKVLKANGRMAEAQPVAQTVNNVLAVNSLEDVRQVLAVIGQMEEERASRRRPSGVVDVERSVSGGGVGG